ncbi:MAG: helix-turn-helix transcriptional regulator [Bacteroidetes bacterium]|nr:helix-turn-helix transcriptional regulator [Bacteroidota bacterium]
MHISDINNAIRNRRKTLSINQSDLADLSQIGLRTIKALESGAANPRINTLQKVCDVLGLEILIRVKGPGD